MRQQLFKRYVFGGKQFGPLELTILEHLESRRNATVRELIDEGIVDRAYTTIAATLDRLCTKGLLSRVREKRTFRYSVKRSVQEMAWKDASERLQRFLSESNGQVLVLSYLVEECSRHEARLLDQLEELIKQKRRTLGKPPIAR